MKDDVCVRKLRNEVLSNRSALSWLNTAVGNYVQTKAARALDDFHSNRAISVETSTIDIAKNEIYSEFSSLCNQDNSRITAVEDHIQELLREIDQT